jgi:3-oxoacyl-[acyl-carrier protein] reductase
MDRIKDKRVVIVTGASRGLGKAIALRFGKAGCRVVVNYRKQEQDARGVADAIQASGGEAICCKADVRISRDAAAMVQQTLDQWDSLDLLVNNAGLTMDGLLLRMSEEQWDDVIETNLTGAFHCIRAAAQQMSKGEGGHIINISSIVGVQGREGQANYAASKAALIGLTTACAQELGSSNIQVNAVLPGYLPTDMGATVSDAIHSKIVSRNALGRTSDAAEVADFIYHLSCMKNVSGQVFNLDSRILQR